MPVIGTFSAVKDGYAGTIRTLTIKPRSASVANDSQGGRRRARLPHHGGADRDRRRLAQDQAGLDEETYLRVKLDDPAPAAADLGRLARGERGWRGAPAVAARSERTTAT